MTDRCQLNLRLDGRRDLLDSCKEVAAAQGLSLNAWVVRQLELGVSGSTQLPTVSATRQPLDNVVNTARQPLDIKEATELPGKHEVAEYDHALTTPEEAVAHAKIFGFTPEEALADAHFQIAMLTANHDELEDRYEAKKREIERLTEQLATERADREEIEAELADLKQKSATAGKDLPDAADLLNQLRAKRKRTKADRVDMEAILEILEN